MTEEEWKIIDKFINLCSENDVVEIQNLIVWHKGYYNDTARGSRERLLIERKVED